MARKNNLLGPGAKPIYAIINRSKEGIMESFAITPDLRSSTKPTSKPAVDPKKTVPKAHEKGFQEVFKTFQIAMDSYQKFGTHLSGILPLLGTILVEKELSVFLEEKGEKLPESNLRRTIYKLPANQISDITLKTNHAHASRECLSHLPEKMMMGLVSSYDAFLSDLLRVAFHRHEEIILISDKSIKLSELITYQSITEAKDAIIDREIEGIIRESHHEQISIIEKKFKISLRTGLECWPQFVEVFERRNLLTHTGGRVSEQYLKIGREHKYSIGGLKVGDQLDIKSEYYRDTVRTVYKVGIKIAYVLWRKLAPDEKTNADSSLNALTFELMCRQAFKTAEPLLAFGRWVVEEFGGSEEIRLMMLINNGTCLNALKRPQNAKKLIDKEDWSAAEIQFKLAAAVVQDDIQKVVQLMKTMGKHGAIKSADYRTWPLFRLIKHKTEFLDTFEKIFHEPFNRPTKDQVSNAAINLKPSGSDQSIERPPKPKIRAKKIKQNPSD